MPAVRGPSGPVPTLCHSGLCPRMRKRSKRSKRARRSARRCSWDFFWGWTADGISVKARWPGCYASAGQGTTVRVQWCLCTLCPRMSRGWTNFIVASRAIVIGSIFSVVGNDAPQLLHLRLRFSTNSTSRLFSISVAPKRHKGHLMGGKLSWLCAVSSAPPLDYLVFRRRGGIVQRRSFGSGVTGWSPFQCVAYVTREPHSGHGATSKPLPKYRTAVHEHI